MGISSAQRSIIRILVPSTATTTVGVIDAMLVDTNSRMIWRSFQLASNKTQDRAPRQNKE